MAAEHLTMVTGLYGYRKKIFDNIDKEDSPRPVTYQGIKTPYGSGRPGKPGVIMGA